MNNGKYKINTISIIGSILLFAGLFFGFVASPDYFALLTICIISESFAIICYIYIFKNLKKTSKIITIIAIAVALIIIIQAVNRLAFTIMNKM